MVCYLKRPTVYTKFVPPAMSGLPSSVEAQTSATCTSTSVIFGPSPRRCTLTVALPSQASRRRFECAYLKFTVSGRSIDTHTCAQCSHASVGLAQARPNNNEK